MVCVSGSVHPNSERCCSHIATERRKASAASIVFEAVRDAAPTSLLPELLHKDLLALKHCDTTVREQLACVRMRAPHPASLPEAEHELIPHPRSPPAEMTYVSAFNASLPSSLMAAFAKRFRLLRFLAPMLQFIFCLCVGSDRF